MKVIQMNKSAMETDHCKKTGENQTSFADCSRLRTVKDSTNSNLHILASAPPILDGSNTGLKRGNDMGLGPQSTSQNIKLLVELPNLSTIRHYPYIQYTAPESHSSGVKCSSPAFGRPLNLPAIYRRLRKLRKLLKHLGQTWRVSKSPQVAG